ncbi:Polysaccharide biosynthesis protein CpsM [Alteracholeplasma palmae J233]|uniref:Polysaccharide biosynthesis protein CpsM n=1 Tax=Alteracholeplasma palmae (strain ATCC 49389 / J233) TaxID=1318466 RepID=U4KQJ5_ALTPJ|nr:glycosyltransferase [Alteracholeplasma palmae]CCV64690.1 Polysaccharide biosynthesis protein CpsM [Alteracholeplasma palmae J233]
MNIQKIKMIPKIIHYCWFGGNEIDTETLKIIESWKNYCPEYKIILWNEENFDVMSNIYTKQAYENKKWAFITDYVRLFALYNYGGIYMDSDVEVIKNLDIFLKNRAFTGMENNEYSVTGLMASEKGHPWIKDILDEYDGKTLIQENGELDLTPNTILITKITAQKYGWEHKQEIQNLKEGLMIYPFDYFCAKNWKDGKVFVTENTYTIHHFKGSWLTEKQKKNRQKNILLVKIFGKKIGGTISRIGTAISEKGFIGSLKYKFRKRKDKKRK